MKKVTISLVGGRLCLDFANTTDWDGPEPIAAAEAPSTYDDVLAWAQQVGVLDPGAGDALRGRGTGERAAEALERLKRGRCAVRAVLVGLAAGGTVTEAALGGINALLATEGPAARLAAAPAASGPGIACAPAAPDGGHGEPAAWLLGPVAWSAADLLVSPRDRARVKPCSGQGCGWLFLDGSRGGARRWCAMGTCGNRAKARARHRRRLARPHAAAADDDGPPPVTRC